MEKNELTNEEIARVFAMYIGCKAKFVGERVFTQHIEGDLIHTLVGIVKNRAYMESFIGAVIDYPIDVEIYHKLLLTPLSAITDEHAIKVARNFVLGAEYEKYRKDKKWCTGVGKDLTKSVFNASNGFGLLYVQVYHHLIQQGYAVPLFFGIDHWANGKTAIELGIAVKK
jgi:hypothetical protein